MGALVLLYLTGVLAAGVVRLAAAWQAHPALIESTVAMAIALLLLVGFLAWPTERTTPRKPRKGIIPRLTARTPRIATLVAPVVDAVRSSRSVAGRHWALALAAATANWLTDLLCLAAASRAFHLPLSLVELAAVYLTVQVVRQIPITPGGIGVIEMSLLAGLISAGAGEAPAAATVLAYRLLSCWMIIPVGLLGWLVLRRPSRTAAAARETPANSGQMPALASGQSGTRVIPGTTVTLLSSDGAPHRARLLGQRPRPRNGDVRVPRAS